MYIKESVHKKKKNKKQEEKRRKTAQVSICKAYTCNPNGNIYT